MVAAYRLDNRGVVWVLPNDKAHVEGRITGVGTRVSLAVQSTKVPTSVNLPTTWAFLHVAGYHPGT